MKTVAVTKYKNLPEPPMPEGHWFFGHGKQLAAHPLKFYRDVHKKFGNVIKLRAIFGFEWYLIVSPEGTEKILQSNQTNYRKPSLVTKTVGLVAGNGLFNSEGDFWRRQRRLMQPAFHRQQLLALGAAMIEEIQRMSEHWEKTYAQTKTPFDIGGEMADLTVRIAAKTLFSSDLSEAESERFAEAMRVAFEHVGYRLLYPFAIPEFVPTPRNLRFKKAKKVLDEVVIRIIEERRRSGAEKNDLLAMLMSARDEETGEMMDERQLKDEVMTLLVAGHETTAAALTWTWYLLAKNPSKAEKLKAEIAEVLGGKPPTVEDLPKLSYARMVFEETLRLYPPAWGQPRESVNDDEIDGFHIKGKKMIVVSQYITQRHKDFWENPEEFIPERFNDKNISARPKFAYFPFGGGARQCIGNHFAMMEAQLIIAGIAQRFMPQLTDEGEAELDVTFTLRPKKRIMMRI